MCQEKTISTHQASQDTPKATGDAGAATGHKLCSANTIQKREGAGFPPLWGVTPS